MSEEEAAQALQYMRQLEAHYAELAAKENTLREAAKDMAGAIAAIDGLGSPGEDGRLDALVPLGSSVFAKASMRGDEKLVVHVGSGAFMEMDRQSAIGSIESRLAGLDALMRDNSSRMADAGARLEQVRGMFRHEEAPGAQARPAQDPAGRG